MAESQSQYLDIRVRGCDERPSISLETAFIPHHLHVGGPYSSNYRTISPSHYLTIARLIPNP